MSKDFDYSVETHTLDSIVIEVNSPDKFLTQTNESGTDGVSVGQNFPSDHQDYLDDIGAKVSQVFPILDNFLNVNLRAGITR